MAMTMGTTTASPRATISKAVQEVMAEAFGEAYGARNPKVTPATKPEFGDYQCNAAMELARPLSSKPRDIAATLAAGLQARLGGICEPPEIAGPGFINLRLKSDFVADRVKGMVGDDERLGIPRVAQAQRVVVDFSSPNIAKEMHVGHLRSTVIGDTICRVLEFRGHDVVRLNHVGDWGTQFGMLITHLKDVAPEAIQDGAEEKFSVGDLVAFYKEAKARFDSEAEFKELARREVVNLQAGDEESKRAWGVLCEASRRSFQEIYSLLGVELEERGESFYNSMLDDVVNDLEAAGLLEVSDGAKVVFLEGFEARDGTKQALIVKKSDGGYMYSTTDLAAIRHRTDVEGADRVLYVVDVGQGSHFAQVFQVARRAGFLPETVRLEHVPFGLVQGEDGKKFKTRSGETVKLTDLLSEAVRIAGEDIRERWTQEGGEGFEQDEEELARVSQVVGIGAVKYADLSMHRESDYRFSYAKMLSLQGNTAPYMLYAFARVQGIKKKAADGLGDLSDDGEITLGTPEEAGLARILLRLPEVLEDLETDLTPHKLCDYLFDLSSRFNRFYEECPVNAAETLELKRSRTALCGVTADVLKLGLGLLGIGTLDRL